MKKLYIILNKLNYYAIKLLIKTKHRLGLILGVLTEILMAHNKTAKIKESVDSIEEVTIEVNKKQW